MDDGSAEADVIAGCDASGESNEVAVRRTSGPCSAGIRRYAPPGRPFEPALAAQRFDSMVCRFGTCSEQFDDFLSRRFPTAALAEGKHDPTFRGDRDRAAKGMSFSVTKPPEIGGFVTQYCIT